MAAKKSTALTVWDKELAEAAHEQAAKEKVRGEFKNIGTRGGILTVDDSPVKGNELRVVVLATAFENAFYDGPFDPNEIKQPVCFALSLDGENMAPHENSTDPQNGSCDGCPHNEFGSAETGRGKACKNVRRLMLVTADSLESAAKLEEAEVRQLKLPPTSGKNWAKYVHRIAEEMNRPAFGVVTLVSIVPDAKTQFKIVFEFEGLVKFDQKLMEVVRKRIAELNKDIVAPYQPLEEDPKPRKKVTVKRGVGPAKRPGKAKF